VRDMETGELRVASNEPRAGAGHASAHLRTASLLGSPRTGRWVLYSTTATNVAILTGWVPRVWSSTLTSGTVTLRALVSRTIDEPPRRAGDGCL